MSQEVDIQQLEEENRFLKRQVEELKTQRRIHIGGFFANSVKLGVVTDTHMGCLYARQDFLEAAYRTFKREGVKDVLHCGDVLAGENMYRGQVYELSHHGADAQVRLCVEKYPKVTGISTHFITGNHDHSFWKRAGINVGKAIDSQREDMQWLGEDEATIVYKINGVDVRVRLAHPAKGTAYALSYQPQKYIEALSGGAKPHIVLIGHYHKAELMPNYRNTYVLQAGCLESQTPFMRTRSIAAHTGFWIIEFCVNQKKRLSRFQSEFFALFEEDF